MSFSMEAENQNKLSFLDAEIIREQGKFTTTVFLKPTFIGVYSDFESFLPSVYKFGMVYTLVYRCSRICSDWTIPYWINFSERNISKKWLENFMTDVLKSF